MNSDCRICSESLKDNGDTFECEGCCEYFHANCVGVTKAALQAKAKCKFLKVFCSGCLFDPENNWKENINTILRYIMKIDLTTQKHEEKFAKLENDIKVISNYTEKNSNQNSYSFADNNTLTIEDNTNKNTYAKVVKNAFKPVVVIKPKNNKQKSSDTINDITNKINPNEIKACGIKKVKNGGVVVCCDTVNSTLKMKNIVETKIGNNYVVKLPEIRKPRLKILNIKVDVNKDTFIDELKSRNEIIVEKTIEIKKIINKTKENRKSYDVVIELDYKSYEDVLRNGFVYFGWNRYNVIDHIHIDRCFKCSGFMHIEKVCKNEMACSLCAGAHKRNECNEGELKCINCLKANEIFNLKYETNHHSYSKQCKTLQRKIDTVRSKIQYKEA